MFKPAKLIAVGAVLAAAQAAHAGPIPLDTFLQFSFDGRGAVVGCQDADPNGNFCAPSSGTPTQFLDAPAWTFSASGNGFTLTVLDAFTSGEQFDIFDFGQLIGSTSLPARLPVDCGDDPATCLATAGMSTGVFSLGAGDHSLTLVQTRGTDLGTGYLMVNAAVPEPASLALVVSALGLMWSSRKRGVGHLVARSAA
jgi:hypothetical protein